MERESFEDDEVAEVLNRNFISIKVDREERPDIDHMYMAYCQALTGAGGWPLTVILTPDKQPFFAGTYFPKRSNYGRPGVMEILEQVSELWQKDKDKVIETAEELYHAISDKFHPRSNSVEGITRERHLAVAAEEVETWGRGALRKAYALMEKSFDSKFGGFGDAPKFPSPHNLGFLIRYHIVEPNSNALSMVEKTLISMADGGIYDHIGYGFARYSTDRYWLVPHFEKMLYDNAGLALIYLEAYQLTHNYRYARVAQEIFLYILRDMTSPEGGFYSAEDADSEGVEGKYYTWDELEMRIILMREIRAINEGNGQGTSMDQKVIGHLQRLKEKLVDIYCEAYGINEEGHYEGKNIPSRIFNILEEIADRNGLSIAEMEQLLGFCNEVLFREREKRIKPAMDDKILVSWNGLMIGAFAKGVQTLSSEERLTAEREALLYTAEKAADFILSKMIDSNGRLLARYRDGDASFLGYLDDYAFMIHGLIELYTACGKTEYLEQAIELQEEQEKLFKDEVNGGYYFTGNDAEELLFRPKEVYDGAMPSGNSISAYNLARLWKITGDERWKELTEQQFSSFKDKLQDYPPGYTAFLQAIQYYLNQGEELVLSGYLHSQNFRDMQAVIFKDFRPYSVISYNEGSLQKIIPRMKDYPVTDKISVYLCRDFVCQEPVGRPEELKDLLDIHRQA